jgi:rSAM/selenodomain-associated transferase 1
MPAKAPDFASDFASDFAPDFASDFAPDFTLIVFARAPAEGAVKTRLVPALGAAGAARLHRRLLWLTLERACAARGARVELWISGGIDHPFVSECARRFGLPRFEQRGADLGQRMAGALASALAARGARRCLLIGTDCPAQSAGDLEQAAAALASHDVALQPAEDGGYVLIGLKRPRPALFEAIDWGGADVTARTLERAAALGLSVAQLRRLPDLDSEADLARARQSGWLRKRPSKSI